MQRLTTMRSSISVYRLTFLFCFFSLLLLLVLRWQGSDWQYDPLAVEDNYQQREELPAKVSLEKLDAEMPSYSVAAAAANRDLRALESPTTHTVYHLCDLPLESNWQLTWLPELLAYANIFQLYYNSNSAQPTLDITFNLFMINATTDIGRWRPNGRDIQQWKKMYSIECEYQFADSTMDYTVVATAEYFQYRQVIHCPLSSSGPPASVHVHMKHTKSGEVYTMSGQVCSYQQPSQMMAICAQPVRNVDPRFFLQWINYNFYLGVDQIFFYDQEDSFRDLPEFKQYIAEGRLIYRRFPIPAEVAEHAHHCIGQPPALNACAEELRYSTKWFSHLDPDEYLRFLPVPVSTPEQSIPWFERRCHGDSCDSMLARYLNSVQEYDQNIVTVQLQGLEYPDMHNPDASCPSNYYVRRCPALTTKGPKWISRVGQSRSYWVSTGT